MQRGSGAGAGPERGRSKDSRSRSGSDPPQYLREISISRSFTRRKSSTGAAGGERGGPGAGGVLSEPAWGLRGRTHTLHLISPLCSIFPFIFLDFLSITFFNCNFGLRPTLFKFVVRLCKVIVRFAEIPLDGIV